MMDVLVRLLNALWMILGPLVLGVFLVRRWRLGWRLFFLGAATFVGSQVLHIPFNQFILLPVLDKLGLIGINDASALFVLGVMAGLSAGVFEEGARYLVYRVWLSDVKRWKGAVLYGAGHGGVEAILLGGLALYAFFQAIAYRGANLSELVPVDQLELAKAQLDAYWSAPWYAAMMGAVERTFAIAIQISLAVLVFQAVKRRKWIWLVIAVGWHAVVDAVAVIGIQKWGIYPTEAAVGLFALISIAIILALREQSEIVMEGEETQESPPTDTLRPSRPSGLDLSDERLENSRYNNGL
jgi:uncharacterized membrane protein YhfC